MKPHPRDILVGAQAGAFALPVCDHYSGVEARMRKSLQLQAELSAEFGTCVFDVTLDCEDGAPVGGEAEHAHEVVVGLLHVGVAVGRSERPDDDEHPMRNCQNRSGKRPGEHLAEVPIKGVGSGTGKTCPCFGSAGT